MKRFILILLLIISITPLFAQSESTDTTSNGLTKEDIGLIMRIFDGQPLNVIKQKAHQLIFSGKDSTEQASIAASIFDYYYNSKIMGYEEVALYIADNFFLNNRFTWPNEDGLMLLKLFAEYNRSSMIGMPSPSLNLPDSVGRTVSLKNLKSKYKLLLFYDEDCRVCQNYTAKLMQYLMKHEYGTLSVLRIYTQADREKWLTWVRKLDQRFQVSKKVTMYDLWDPDFSSDFQKKFGVLTTPQMILLDENNIIIGRKLDPKAAATIIDNDFNKATELDLFLDKLFTSLLPYDNKSAIDTTLITGTIDDLYNKSKEDTTLFQEIMFSTYQYLKSHSEYDFQKGAAYLAREYIVPMPQMWESANFSEETNAAGVAPLGAVYASPSNFVSETQKSVTLFYRNMLGKPVANLRLSTIGKNPYSIYDSNSKYTILYFYDISCSLCEIVSEDMKKIYEKYKDEDLTILGIYIGNDKKGWPKYVIENGFEWINLWDRKQNSDMYAKYDLSAVPKILLIDENKETIAKDINPAVLEQILEYLYNRQNND